MPLTDTAIRNAKPLDELYKQGLYLLIKPNGSKLWQLKYRFGGKEKKLALGAYPTVTLANARKLREEARAVLSAGGDPGVKKQQEKQPHCRAAGTKLGYSTDRYPVRTGIFRHDTAGNSAVLPFISNDFATAGVEVAPYGSGSPVFAQL
jgi:hypothetical protein